MAHRTPPRLHSPPAADLLTYSATRAPLPDEKSTWGTPAHAPSSPHAALRIHTSLQAYWALSNLGLGARAGRQDPRAQNQREPLLAAEGLARPPEMQSKDNRGLPLPQHQGRVPASLLPIPPQGPEDLPRAQETQGTCILPGGLGAPAEGEHGPDNKEGWVLEVWPPQCGKGLCSRQPAQRPAAEGPGDPGQVGPRVKPGRWSPSGTGQACCSALTSDTGLEDGKPTVLPETSSGWAHLPTRGVLTHTPHCTQQAIKSTFWEDLKLRGESLPKGTQQRTAMRGAHTQAVGKGRRKPWGWHRTGGVTPLNPTPRARKCRPSQS